MIPNEKEEFMVAAKHPLHFLDITKEVCPFTFVYAKLLVERAGPGEIVEIRLNAGEPLINVPGAIEELGHRILHLAPEIEGAGDGVHRLWVEKR